jgi:hypothetical protein
MRDSRDDPSPHYCKECGSTFYDKEWGLTHYQTCRTILSSDSAATTNYPQQPNKNNWSAEMQFDLKQFFGAHK